MRVKREGVGVAREGGGVWCTGVWVCGCECVGVGVSVRVWIFILFFFGREEGAFFSKV